MSTPQTKIRVLVVDDHRLLRDGLAALLADADDIEIVGSASSGEEAISIFPSIRPDVVLMVIILHGMTGIEATRWLKGQDIDVKVILISSEKTKELVTTGIQCGIDGYLPKDVDIDVLRESPYVQSRAAAVTSTKPLPVSCSTSSTNKRRLPISAERSHCLTTLPSGKLRCLF